MELVYLYICLIPVLISAFIGIIVAVNNEMNDRRNKHIDEIINTKEKSEGERLC